MTGYSLGQFLDECETIAAVNEAPADAVLRLVPAMQRLISVAGVFLEPPHLRPDPGHYARNLVYAAEDDSLSLFALVWEPGQWTPVHDHGSWGVVGVFEGYLEERAYMRVDADPQPNRDHGIDLQRGGLVLLSPGSVTTFVPNPDHIHVTGVPEDRLRAVSLHLYGRMMDQFHAYDVAAGTRELIAAPHFES